MINNGNSNQHDQDSSEGGDSLRRSSLSLGVGGAQGAFLASLLGPIQSDTPTASASEQGNNASICFSNPATGSGAASDPLMQSMLLGRLDSQNLQTSQQRNLGMGAFDTGASLQNQASSQGESAARLFSQPKQNLTMDQVFGSNNAAAAEFRAFFGPGSTQDLQVGGSMQSSSNTPAQGLSSLSAASSAQPSLSGSGGLLGQQNANIHSLSGNLPVQNTLNFNSALSLAAPDTLRSQMSLHNALNSSWQQNIQQTLPLQQQLQQPSQQHQQLPLDQALHGQAQQIQQIQVAAGWNDAAALGGPPQLPPEIKWKGRGRSSTFPLKLHQMLLDLEKQEGGTAIASFLPHGRGFQIHKPKEFSKEIMPNYFRMSTYSSFQRQLNLYDFQRIAEGPEKGAYWHELFIRDQPMLSTNMKRSKVKGATRARQDERLKNYERQKDGYGR